MTHKLTLQELESHLWGAANILVLFFLYRQWKNRRDYMRLLHLLIQKLIERRKSWNKRTSSNNPSCNNSSLVK